VDRINNEIANALKKEDSELLDNLQRPCTVFVTFESEEGYNRALVYNENPTCRLLGESVKITEASEPTDIIWENRHYTEGLRNMKRLIVYLVIICVLGVAAWMIYTFSILS
jgi:hypothetical protein|tara:strand:- start:1980 stop:2312 length:333 start_codon:yes stop_codon:yes gene_type:complete